MAKFYLQNASVRVAWANLTGYTNKVNLKLEADVLDATTFQQAHQVRLGGLKTISFSEEGLWDSDIDSFMFLTLGGATQAVTVIPEGNEAGTAYMFQAGQFSYEEFGAIGQVTPFAFSMSGTNGVGIIRGQAAAVNQSVAATGQLGSILTMAGPTANQYLYATLHLSPVGTTITVIIESAPASNFAAPTTRATIGPLTVSSGTFMTRVAGPITDGFWRMKVSAITGTFLCTGAIGIQ